MSARRGVLSAGTWCVDFNKSIARWPSEDTSNEVLRIDRQGGGSGFNMALDLKRLDPGFPGEAMGVVGDDDLGRFLFGECDAHGAERDPVRGTPGGGTTLQRDGTTDVDLVARAVDDVLALGPLRWVVAHFPEGAVAGRRDGTRLALGSVGLPASAIAGANGAGDAFAAGMLYALHEDWPIGESLRLAHACAAASMRAVSTTEGVGTVAECLVLADKWGLRPIDG